MGNFSIYFINSDFVLKLYALEASDLVTYSLSFEASMFVIALYGVGHWKPLGRLAVIHMKY